MKKLLTLSQFTSYLTELQTNGQLRVAFKSRYAWYGIKDINLIPVSADFHVMWKLLLEYQAFLKLAVTYNMFYDETMLFTGLVKSNAVADNIIIYSIADINLFAVSGNDVQSFEVPLEKFATISPSLFKSPYLETGEMIDLTPYTSNHE